MNSLKKAALIIISVLAVMVAVTPIIAFSISPEEKNRIAKYAVVRQGLDPSSIGKTQQLPWYNEEIHMEKLRLRDESIERFESGEVMEAGELETPEDKEYWAKREKLAWERALWIVNYEERAVAVANKAYGTKHVLKKSPGDIDEGQLQLLELFVKAIDSKKAKGEDKRGMQVYMIERCALIPKDRGSLYDDVVRIIGEWEGEWPWPY